MVRAQQVWRRGEGQRRRNRWCRGQTGQGSEVSKDNCTWSSKIWRSWLKRRKSFWKCVSQASKFSHWNKRWEYIAEVSQSQNLRRRWSKVCVHVLETEWAFHRDWLSSTLLRCWLQADWGRESTRVEHRVTRWHQDKVKQVSGKENEWTERWNRISRIRRS